MRLVLAVALLLTSVGALAADEARSKAAADLLEAVNARSMIQTLQGQMGQMVDAQMKQMNIPDRDLPIVERYKQQQIDLVSSTLDWDKFQPKLINLYAQVLTESEMNDAAIFYRSPAGQKLLARQPELMQRSIAMMQESMKELQPQILELQNQLRAELKQNHPESQPKP